MAKLMLHRQILKDFSKLPRKVQKRISELIREFEEDPQAPSIGLHALKETMLDPKVRGIKKFPDGYRAIVIAPEKGDTFLLVHVDTHDEAYSWAKNKRFEVHEMTGIFQVFDPEKVSQRPVEAPVAAIPAYALGRFTDDELFHAGVPRPLLPAVKDIHSDFQLDALSEYLPPDCRDVLYGLAAGMQLDEILEVTLGATAEELRSATPDSPGDFSHIEHAANFDLVMVEGEEHLKDILSASLDEWRIFLHPYQRKLVQKKTKGPMNITGAAGTGKTVALMHRAVYLARALEAPDEKVLVTTYTTNLAVTIKDLIGKLGPSVADRIEVVNLHRLARTICSRSGWQGGRIAEIDDMNQIWQDVWSDPSLGELPMPQADMHDEFNLIVDPNGIDNEEDYLTTVRSGRPRISRKQRRAAWPVFRLVLRGLKKRNLLTIEGAIHEARLAVEQGNFQRFRHVLVDEVQDFSLAALKLIKALSPTDEELPDPLCTAGDGHQRIYRQRIPLSRAGINIVGRSSRLKVNYRTSEQIRRYAIGMLQGEDIDDLDDGKSSIEGDHSVFTGPDPVIRPCTDEADEGRVIVEWLQSLLVEGSSFDTHDICITPGKKSIIGALHAAGIKTLELKAREMDPGKEEAGVRIATMKRLKGLEFKAVAMACCTPSEPMNDLASASLLERCERYVAATRAREVLLITIAK